uniref:Laminin IV type A domain-containing protein n=1 Tax=Aureoumbra lagunensis TaxID=44058 RepID=A0A7S3K4L5_9STRA|mmetsp:Transcript_14106/g.21304  ORF Transcript_14106/g.21304 Transcript_14106/m.21304 type:complete len:330 (+) Transcript_14106:29-1018(+)
MFFTALLLVCAYADQALEQTIEVGVGSEIVIRLKTYGNKNSQKITRLPDSGTLYHLSKVYAKYGYEPKRGKLVQLDDSVDRVLYERPKYDTENRHGAWGYFVWGNARVNLVGPSHILIASRFDNSDEQWQLVRNRASSPTWDPAGLGIHINRFIIGFDDLVHKSPGSTSETNSSRFLFSAPSKFLHRQAAAYGGTLEFALIALAGEIFSKNSASRHNLVEIQGTNGITLTFPLWNVSQSTNGIFSIPLNENSGWIQDPKNELLQWSVPSKCTFIQTLADIRYFYILGDFSDWYESIALDNVLLRAGRGTDPSYSVRQLPLCSQLSPCSC